MFFVICAALWLQNTPLHADEPPPHEQPTLAKFEPQGNRVYHGASLPDTWNEEGLSRQLENFKGATGKEVAIVTWFASAYENGTMRTWGGPYADTLARVRRMGAVSLIKFSTQDFAYARTRKAADLKHIAAGVWDEYFKDAADKIKSFGSPVFISINHEMNGTWYPYSEAFPGSQNTAADYVASWRRIVDIFRERGATNVAWVWSPMVPDVGPVPSGKYYPGDDYVDWVGVSFYSSNPPTALDALYRAYSQRKPFFITEWGTGPQMSRYNPKYPGDEAWINQFFQALETRYRRVKAISWFEWKKQDGNHLLNRDAKQLRAYAKQIRKPRYIGRAEALLAPIVVENKGPVELKE